MEAGRRKTERTCVRRIRPKRAFVVAVCGAGGKTSYIRAEAERRAAEGKLVAVLTTTHIYDPRLIYGLADQGPVCTYHGVDYFGEPAEGGKLGPVSPEAYREICRTYDLVYVEADGSCGMPVKIPLKGEPVLPEGVSQVILIMGRQAIGRRPEAVCQHFREGIFADRDLTEEDLRRVARTFYEGPIKRRRPDLPVSFVLSGLGRRETRGPKTPKEKTTFGIGADDGKETGRPLTLVLMASGFGRRYSDKENKLLVSYLGKPLYQHALHQILLAARSLREETGRRVHVAVVTRSPEIMDHVAEIQSSAVTRLPSDMPDIEKGSQTGAAEYDDLSFYQNPGAEEGITSSIRIGTRVASADGAGAVAFFAADMPYLESREISRFLEDFLASGKRYGCMAYREEGDPVSTRSDRQDFPQATSVLPDRHGYAASATLCRKASSTLTIPGAFRLDTEKGEEDLLSLHGDKGAMRLIRSAPWHAYLHYVDASQVRDIDYPEDRSLVRPPQG